MTIEPVALIETKVTVSRSHIAMGHRLRCYSCPLALAVDDLIIEGYKALVSPTELVIHKSNLLLRDKAIVFFIPNALKIVITLPADAIQFVEDFDNQCTGHTVSPTTFTIPIPRHLLRNPASTMEVRP